MVRSWTSEAPKNNALGRPGYAMTAAEEP